jgi:hypothetical protein
MQVRMALTPTRSHGGSQGFKSPHLHPHNIAGQSVAEPPSAALLSSPSPPWATMGPRPPGPRRRTTVPSGSAGWCRTARPDGRGAPRRPPGMRSPSSPDALVAGRHTRARNAVTHSGPPCGAVNTKASGSSRPARWAASSRPRTGQADRATAGPGLGRPHVQHAPDLDHDLGHAEAVDPEGSGLGPSAATTPPPSTSPSTGRPSSTLNKQPRTEGKQPPRLVQQQEGSDAIGRVVRPAGTVAVVAEPASVGLVALMMAECSPSPTW